MRCVLPSLQKKQGKAIPRLKPLPGPWIPPQKLLRRKLQVRFQEVTKILDSKNPAPLIA